MKTALATAAPFRWIDPGEWAMHNGPGELVTLLGSCVSLVLWHPRFRVGGMCHCIHPRMQPRAPGTPRDAAYAPDGFEVLRDAFAGSGMALADCRIVIAGGANTVLVRPGEVTIGERNVRWLLTWLAQQGLTAEYDALGGACSRRVVVDCLSGDIRVIETPIEGVAPARVSHG